MVRAQCLIAAAALLDGRTTASAADLWPVVYAVPTAEGQGLARETLRELLGRTESRTLMGAAAEASGGPLARAARIVEAGNAVLDAAPPEEDELAHEGWVRRVEGIGREIDACFAPSSRPAALELLRARVASVLSERLR